MKATGVVRRIDELGRIVIPKEIRKNFRIKEGENIEIFIEDENIILKKYSTLFNLKEITSILVKSFNQITNLNIIITDNSNIMDIEGEYKNIDLKLSDDYFKLLQDRKTLIGKTIDFFIPEVDKSYIISPINLNGDIIGGIIVFSDNNITKEQEQMINLLNKILVNYIEQ